VALDDLKAIVRRELEELYGAGNLDLADEIVASSYVGNDPALPEPRQGPQGVKEAVTGYRTAFPDLQISIEAQLQEKDTVVTRWTAVGTHEGELFGIAPTGKQVTVTGISIERFKEGQIVEEWTSWDTLGLLVQLGAVPAPASS
jgi:steroid delta-isomerase-like uncharacterized protein